MTDLEASLAALSPEKRALFEELMRERGLTADARDAETAFPVSVMQQGIWFLEQLRPHNPAYIVPAALHMRGPLDAGVLLDALNEIVRRHESLRTTFQLRDGRPTQVVRRELTLELPETDLGGQRLDARQLEQRITEALADPFDLATGPLLRFRLLRLGPDEHVLALAMHHLISDGWSVGVLVSELSALYAAFSAGKPSPLPELPIQYGDFAVWQQEQAGAAGEREDLDYWREHLAGANAPLELATDRPRPAVQGFNGASVPFELPKKLMAELAAVGKRHRATPYMALLAVFKVLLHRYSNQGEVTVGVPTANRGRAEVEPLIGFFVNTLPVRTLLAGDPGFAEVLRRVRESCLGAYAHQGIPFEKVVTELRPERDLSRPPFFQVSLSYQSDPLPALAMAGISISRLPLSAQGARFDLELQFFDDAGRLTGWFEYDRDLFDEATIAGLAGHFRRLVELVVADQDTPVDRLELLDDAERHRIVVERNATAHQWPDKGLVHECFEERARRHPRAEAVRFEGHSLTYGELDRRANQLAHRLVRLGVRRDTLVGVSMERSLELVVSLLAVLKAGGAYVPMDPGYPPARLAYMLGDAKAPVLLTQRRVLERLPEVSAEVLCVEELAGELDRESADGTGVRVDGEDLAYVIYTSGSTGRPKGVMNIHSALRNRLLWMQDAYRLDATDRVLQKTPFSFDVSVWEFFWPLMTGAVLVVASPEAHKDSGRLAGTIRAEGVTTVHFVPSMLQLFLQEPQAAECSGLRRVICSGEALPEKLQERFFACSQAELHNLYGPTEAAIDVSAWACRPDAGPGPVPIGHPIANTRLHVLDHLRRPVPDGVPGELYIGGANLARGYLGRPELTEERFVPSPFGPEPGARLYRTGDLARYRGDGALEFLGRLDHQVKLRGQRLELGEIEAVLAQHPAVREAVVVAREHTAGDVRLIAYLTAETAGDPDGEGRREPDTGELTAHLRERLPEFMVPAAFVVLAELPLTPNGKADRAALPEPQGVRPELRTRFVAPRDGLEAALAGMWRDLLGVEQVGAHDNFFDLGGHSLLMAEFRARLAAGLGHELSMVELFQYPTIGSLTERLDRSSAPGAEPTLGAQQRAESRRQTRNRRQQSADRRARSRNGR
ncbi:tyrocidine synthetase I [Streptomyces sp. NBRC 110611]|uniref:non-ribosomal peptide synthetase n=1 Tax=Streptomyces sp. NBRC 110611 TaxID=1621259 RepID=UPI00082DC08D|nr:non-ribosomal peptide synthetase [Streptomyces sp. NBRC 110611]GAU68945.1 tyrocidine synthetase I [Streptomyces sp. NBRC 110611]